MIGVDDVYAGKKKYGKNQALSQANACGNEYLPMNVGCQNTGSQIQGEENGAALAATQVFPGQHNNGGNNGGHDGGTQRWTRRWKQRWTRRQRRQRRQR